MGQAKICPLSGEQCVESCAWRLNDECVVTRISYALYILNQNMNDLIDALEGEQE